MPLLLIGFLQTTHICRFLSFVSKPSKGTGSSLSPAISAASPLAFLPSVSLFKLAVCSSRAMVPRKSSYLVAVVLASLLLSAMAGGHRKKLLSKDGTESMAEMTEESMLPLQEEAVVIHERILKQVRMDDYGRYDPTPTMSKPHFKDIPN